MQSVRKFYDDDTEVSCKGHKQFAKILCLCFFTIVELQFVQLGDSFNKGQYFCSEHITKFVGGDGSVLKNIVQKRGYDG